MTKAVIRSLLSAWLLTSACVAQVPARNNAGQPKRVEHQQTQRAQLSTADKEPDGETSKDETQRQAPNTIGMPPDQPTVYPGRANSSP